MEEKEILPITNYLNQKIVFDMLAVIEDGFSQVANITSSSSTNKSSNTKGDGELGFGVSNTFGLLNITSKLRASFSKEKSQNDSSQQNEERVHTPTSLFSKLLIYLEGKDLIKNIYNESNLDGLNNGEFVRFSCQLRQNPLVEMLETMEQVFLMFNRLEKTGKKKKEDEETFQNIKAMKKSLKNDDIIDLICTINYEENLKAVIPVYMNYFYNQNMSELIDGNFTVVGKVVKIVNDNEDDINLFRNTGFKLFKQSMLEDLFDTMRQGEELEFPEMNSKISNPSLLVIPIAIYS